MGLLKKYDKFHYSCFQTIDDVSFMNKYYEFFSHHSLDARSRLFSGVGEVINPFNVLLS